jgi:RHS repeat-associated core domain
MKIGMACKKRTAILTLLFILINTIYPAMLFSDTESDIDSSVTSLTSEASSTALNPVQSSIATGQPIIITPNSANANINVDETYQLFSKKSGKSIKDKNGNTAYIRHIANLPQDEDENLDSSAAEQDEAYTNQADQYEPEDENETVTSKSKEIEKTEVVNSKIEHSNTLVPADEANAQSSNKAIKDEYSIRNKQGYYNVGFTDKAGKSLVYFSYGKSALGMNPADAENAEAEIDGNTITYAGIYPDTDFKYTAEDYMLKEEIILNKLSDKNEFIFNLNSENVNYDVMSNGDIRFKDKDTQQPVFYIAKSYATDNEGNVCDSVTTSISDSGELKVAVDADWLKNAAYPVIVDPTIYLPNITFDRGSVAYMMDGTGVSQDTPRYEAGKFGQGILIEESTTQLLPQARSLSFSSAWTSDTLDGTYTISIRAGTGKLTLSGGATGVVTVGNSLTFTVSSATVKFTPSGGTPQRCQLEQKSYATQWQQGASTSAKTRAAETLYLPTEGIFNQGNWAVEVKVKLVDKPNTWGRIWECWLDSNNYYCIDFDTNGKIYGTVSSAGVQHLISMSAPAVIGTTYNICFSGDGTYIYFYVDGVLIGQTTYTEPVGDLPSRMYIGSHSDSSCYGNCIFDDVRFSNRARTLEEHQAAISSNQALPVDGVTTGKLNFDGNLELAAYNVTSGNGSNTMELSTTFNRDSTANNNDLTEVEDDEPRYEAATYRQGILIEEAESNCLSDYSTEDPNPSTSKFELNQYNSGTLTGSTDEHKLGAGCIKWVGADTSSLRGIRIVATNKVAASEYITYSVYLKGSGTCRLGISFDGGTWQAQSQTITLTSEWTRYSVTYKNSSGTRYTCLEVAQYAVSTPATIYMDCFQAEKSSFMTSWHLGTRASETLTLPTTCMTKGSWTVEMIYTPWYAPTSGIDERVLWYTQANSTNYWILGTNASGYLYGTVCKAGTSYTITSSIIPSVGTSYSIMFAGNGSIIRLCVNGAQIGSDTTYSEPTISLPGTMYIGCSNEETNQCNGTIDDFRISSRARTVAEHQEAYNSNEPLPIDDSTTVKFNFDGSVNNSNSYTPEITGTGVMPYWNYTSGSLGGGWSQSVNTYNLNLLINKSLFNIPGRGIPIQDGLTYNSLDSEKGPVGIGWHLNSDMSLTETEDGSIIFNGGDGSGITFSANSDGSYTSPPGIYLTLEDLDIPYTTSYSITDKDQTVYTFTDGKLTKIVDRNDNTTTFAYNAKGLLDTMTDASGRSLSYTYTNGLLTEITDPAQRSYRLAYQNNYLTSVTDPNSEVVSITYDINGHLNTFVDSLERDTTFNIGTNGQLAYIDDARTAGQDVYRTTFSVSDENTQLVTSITDPLNHVSTYYHDPRSGNLIKFKDAIGDTVEYEWSNNTLESMKNAKGTTAYTYDSRGNVLTRTRDSSSGELVETMTYDDYNQVLTYRDGGGHNTNYSYDVKGNLLSTSDPDIQESNGRKYDQYGNVIEYSPRVSGRANLISNGSFEREGTGGSLLADWTQTGTGASLEGFDSHGNSALKISCAQPGNNYFEQTISSVGRNKNITFRADVKLSNVQYSGDIGGAIIKISYGDGTYYGSWYIWGNGTFPLVFATKSYDEDITIQVGLVNATGTVWFDGVQLENAEYNPCCLSAFNSLENSSFGEDVNFWSGGGSINDNYAWDGDCSLRFNGSTTAYQDVPTYGGEPLTLSGMVKTSGIRDYTGRGAYLKVDYYDSEDQLIPDASVETGRVTGTQDFTLLSTLATAPLHADYARVSAVLTGSGYAYFDSIKLITRNTEVYTYDSDGNYVVESEDSLGKASQYTYNNDTGQLASFTDPTGHTTNYYYDSLGQLKRVRDPLSNNAYYGYDDASNLISSRDPRSSSLNDDRYLTEFEPNELNQLSNLTDPASKTTVNTYDRAGNLINVQQPNGKEIDYEYDDANYLHQKTLDGGEYFTYTYDGAKNVIEVTDGNSDSYSWDYDGSGRVQYSEDTLGKRYDYRWDESNRLTAIVESEDNTVIYYYGDSNYLLSTDSRIGSTNYFYDENGHVFWSNCGTTHRYLNYQANGWCRSLQDNFFPNNVPFNYEYNDNGNISSISFWAGLDSYAYDANGRLTSWEFTPTEGAQVTEDYSYDAAGNLTTKGDQDFAYDNANHITNSGYEYDDNGNLVSDGTYNYTYDAENKLTAVRRTSNNNLVATYTYYYNGLRKSKTVGTLTTYYHWDAFGNLASQDDSQGNSIDFYYDKQGNPIGFTKNDDSAQSFIYHINKRGDIVSVTASTGSTIEVQYNYDPWGTQISNTGTLTQPLRYAGYYYDEETGLYYLKSRYYSPSMGRFLTKDGYGFISNSNPQTLNLYTYCNNNPIKYSDPNGNTQEGDENLPQDVQDVINAAGEDWLVAYQNGDQAGMDAAHATAEAARASVGAYSFYGQTIVPMCHIEDVGATIPYTAGDAAWDATVSTVDIFGGRTIRKKLGVEASYNVEQGLDQVANARNFAPSSWVSRWNAFNKIKDLINK